MKITQSVSIIQYVYLGKKDGRSSQVKAKLSMNSWAVMVPTLSKEPLAALHIPPKNEYKVVPIRIRGVTPYCIDNNDITS